MKLTATEVKALRKPGRHSDGDGLHLFITKTGNKSWVQRIVIGGLRRDIGLGGYPTVSLAQARRRALDNREAVENGKDPVAEKHRPAMPTFREARPRRPRSQQAPLAQRSHTAAWIQDTAAPRLPQDRQQAHQHHHPLRPAVGPHSHMVDATGDGPSCTAKDENHFQVGHGQ